MTDLIKLMDNDPEFLKRVKEATDKIKAKQEWFIQPDLSVEMYEKTLLLYLYCIPPELFENKIPSTMPLIFI